MAQKFVSLRRAEDKSLPAPPPVSVGYSACSRSSKWDTSSPIKCLLPDLEMEDIPHESLPSLSGRQSSITLWGGLNSSPLPKLPFGVEEELEEMSAHEDWLNCESDAGPIDNCTSSSTSSSLSSSSSSSSSSPTTPSQPQIQLPELSRRTYCERWLEENERERELCTRALRAGLENKAKRIERKIEKLNGVFKGYLNRYERVLEQIKSLDE